MSPAELSNLVAHWPACLQLALWFTGIGVIMLTMLLAATGAVLEMVGLLTRYDPRKQDRSSQWRSTTTNLTKKFGGFSK